MTIIVRQAGIHDAPGMARVLDAILDARGRDRPRGAAHVEARYVHGDGRVPCAVEQDASGILGFQSLRRMGPSNPYDLPEGWGVIGTYVRLGLHRSGARRALFSETLARAREAGLAHVDATVPKDSPPALAYYDRMGFRDWRDRGTAQGKRLDLR